MRTLTAIRAFRRTLRRFASSAVACLACVSASTQAEQPGEPEIVRSLLVPGEVTEREIVPAWVRPKTRAVARFRLNPELATNAVRWLRPGASVRLDLMQDQDIRVQVESAEPTATGGLLVCGNVAADASSRVTMLLEHGTLTGFASVSGLGGYRITTSGGGGWVEVSPVEAGAHALCGTAVPAAASAVGRGRSALPAAELPPADTLPEPTVVDVLFLYTPQALAAEGSVEALRQRVLESVDSTNLRLKNSLVRVEVNPVFIGQIVYTESGDLPTDGFRLGSGTGGLERVPQLRNDYKADLVCLIVESDRSGYWGLNGDVTPPLGNPATGWMVVRRHTLYRDGSNLPHELGHLFGCDHDREHAVSRDPAFYAGRKPYLFGHRFQVENVTYTDVMSYEPGILTPYFSHPQLSLDGVPRGVPAGSERAADGARTINETAPYVARYRTARSRLGFAEREQVVREGNTNAVVRLVRSGDLETSTRVSVLFEGTSTARSGQDYTRPSSTLVQFATNQAAAELVIPILADDVVEAEETIRLSLSGVLGDHGLGTNSMLTVTLRDAAVPESHFAVRFDDGATVVRESAGRVEVKVSCQPGAFQPGVTVPFRTEDGTALAGVDYEAVSGSWTMSETSSPIRIPIVNRTGPNPDRSFRLVVGSRTNEVRILDEQRPGSLVIAYGESLGVSGRTALRDDGSMLIWGSFDHVGGVARDGLALLKPDGTVDDAFRPPALLLGHRRLENIGEGSANALIRRVVIQPDGRILVAGLFSRVNGEARGALIRLFPDGRLDEDFGRGLGFDSDISDLAVQPDGRILAVGDFEMVSGVRRPFIVRLMPDGTPDESFRPNGGPVHDASTWVGAVAVQPDGRILIGGRFHRVDGVSMPNLARLNANGTLDGSFKLRGGAGGQVEGILLQADGRIVVTGIFESVGGRASRRLARLNADGSNDASFRPPNPDGDIPDVVSLPDGRLLVGGVFTRIAGQSRPFLARLNADGTLDGTFDPGDLPVPASMGGRANVLGDGSLILNGDFAGRTGPRPVRLLKLRFGDVAPRLGAPVLHGDRLEARVHGVVGGRYRWEASDDLQRWTGGGEVRVQGFQSTATLTVPVEDGVRLLRLTTPTP